MTVRGHLGHSRHEIIEFLILGEVRREASRTAALDVQRADFGLFSGLVKRVPLEPVLRDKGVWEDSMCFKKEVLKAPEKDVHMSQKMSWLGRPSWQNWHLCLDG